MIKELGEIGRARRKAKEDQKEGQEDQGEIKELGGIGVLRFPGPPGLPPGSSLGCLELPQGIYF